LALLPGIGVFQYWGLLEHSRLGFLENPPKKEKIRKSKISKKIQDGYFPFTSI